MKWSVIIFSCMFFSLSAAAQIRTDSVLEAKLSGLTNFYTIKNTVLKYYHQKLNDLSTADSSERKKIMRQLKFWNRHFWITENYLDENGEISDGNALNEKAYEILKKKTSSSRGQPINWISQGPNSVDFSLDHGEGIGRIDVLEFHPTNPNIIFAGSPYGGLFKTVNGGASWSPLSGFIPSLGISGIAIDYSNPNIIYVLTGDKNTCDNCFVNQYLYRGNSTGVYKSYDGGLNWQLTGLSVPGVYFGRELMMDPINPNILIAATSEGIFRTTNGGATWANVSGGSINIWDIAFKPGDNSIVYAAGDNTFWKSTDNGVTFSMIPINLLSTAARISMAVTPANPARVVLLAGTNSAGPNTLLGVFSSGNSGDAFGLVYNDNTDNLFNNYIGTNTTGTVIYNNTITVNPYDENILLAGGVSIWSSHDGGYHWRQETAYWSANANLDDYTHPDIHHLVYSPNGTLYCSNDGGVYRGDVDGNEWDWPFISNGLNTTQFYHFERQNDEDVIWGGAQDNGILQQDSGTDFSIYTGGDGYDEMTDRDYLVADGDNNDVFFTINNFIRKDCATGTCDISVPGVNEFFGNLAMSPDLEDKIYVGYQAGTYISNDAGSNWTNLGNIPGNWCISTCPSNTNVIYAAGQPSGSTGGTIKRWESPNAIIDLTPMLVEAGYNTSFKITDIDVDPANYNIVYVSIGSTSANVKVFRSADGGSTWINLASSDLPNVPVFSVKCDQNNGVYAGTGVGVFYKRNNVNYWEYFSNGLPPVPVTEIELWFNTEVWISTFGRGIWNTSQYAPCQVNISLTGDVSGSYYKEASNEITSTQLIQGGIGTDVKYNKGNIIRLLPGFKATFGCKFRTYSTGCGGETD